ncbi:MAG TPA: tryptophan synthase subunit alpha [Kiritimatiellia bacterium]|nr:tryptophan synthase subunit alpha [Kiritimatiellia bacterium]
MTMTRIDHAFAGLRKAKQKGFIAYITAGDPNLDATVDIVLRLEQEGVDVIELGLPFSDPLADGKVNQESAARALEAGTTPFGVLDCVAKIRKRSQIPLMCYTYMNPLVALGFERFAKRAAEAGLDGLLLLDLPVEEATNEPGILAGHGLNFICLVTPTTPEERIKKIAATASGFIYCVSREGVTGVQEKLGKGALDLVKRTRKHTKLPLALGFGISTPDHARAAAKPSDAVVVGSAIVSRFHQEPKTAKGRQQAAAWVGGLVRAVKET